MKATNNDWNDWMHGRAALSAAAVLALGALSGCSNENWRVERKDPAAQTDVNYAFNDQDAREIFDKMTADCLSKPWIDHWMASSGGNRPIIFLGNVRNNTQEYINTELFTDEIQRELINSGRVRVKAEKDAREELRDERLDTKYNDPETIKAVAMELNADFALVGAVNDNQQRSGDGRTVVSYYQATMELINVETAEKVWVGIEQIKKVATR